MEQTTDDDDNNYDDIVCDGSFLQSEVKRMEYPIKSSLVSLIRIRWH